MGTPVDIIEPCGFPFSERSLKRSGMDYLDLAEIKRHVDFDSFNESRKHDGSRLVLLTTKAAAPYTEFDFADNDILLLGRESAGVPDAVHELADARVKVPMAAGARSLNVAIAAAMVLGEALRQTRLT